MVKNLPSNAGVIGSIPGGGTKIPQAAGPLSPRATTTEPMQSGACVPQLEISLCATTREAHVLQRSHVLQLKPNTAK